MPPKKTRAAGAPPSASQPLPQPTRASGRKRRLSDTSNASERPVSSQSNATSSIATATAAAKRRKKGKTITTETEVIVEETEQATGGDELECDAPVFGGDSTDERTLADSIAVSQPRKQVHFGNGEMDVDDEKATGAATTPHPRKMTVKRRFTLSPSAAITNTIKRLRTTSATRTSLPQDFSQTEVEDADPVTIVQELQFAPLRTVLDERVRRRLRRSHLSEEQNDIEDHEKRSSRTQQELELLRSQAADQETQIQDLAYELETQRQAAIDVGDDSEASQQFLRMERELAALRADHAHHIDTHGLDEDLEAPDQEMLVLNRQHEIMYPQLPSTSQTFGSISKGSLNGKRGTTQSEMTLARLSDSTTRTSLTASTLTAWEVERRRFEDAIVALSRDANDAKAELQILNIELQALGFGDDTVSTKVILESIRESFAIVRESLEDVLPGTVPDGTDTGDILEILIANVKEFADRLRLQDKDLNDHRTTITDLGHQIQGLLNHLADAKIKEDKLRIQWRELDTTNDAKARTIEELEEELQIAQEERDSLQAELDAKAAEAASRGADFADSVKNVEKLQLSLENYRNEETRLTVLITKMEHDHRADIARLVKERNSTVQALQEKLDTETQQRGDADILLLSKQTTVVALELQVVDLVTERDLLLQELEQVKADRDTERVGRETAEADLEDKMVQVEDLESRVDRLEEQLIELTAQIEELRQLNETERHQREAAETDLDDRNAEIEDLNNKLREQGKQANELRLKLFEVQQQNDQRVAELELVASERDDVYQSDIREEVERREAAEELAAQRAATILELETKIVGLELLMRGNLDERDAKIEELENELADRDTEIEGLRLDLRSAENTLDIEKTSFADRAEELNGSIATLQDTIILHETTILRLQKTAAADLTLHDSEIEDRNTTIAELNHKVSTLENEVDELEREKAGLEKRVEQEAEQMLEMSNERADEIDALKAVIADKQSKILIVEEKAHEADEAWTKVLASRDEEIATLKTETTSDAEYIETLTVNLETIKRHFRAHATKTAGVIANLQAAVRTAKTVADDEGEKLNAETELMLGEIEALEVVGELRTRKSVTKTVQTVGGASSQAIASQVSSSGGVKKVGKGRKKRVEEVEMEEA